METFVFLSSDISVNSRDFKLSNQVDGPISYRVIIYREHVFLIEPFGSVQNLSTYIRGVWMREGGSEK